MNHRSLLTLCATALLAAAPSVFSETIYEPYTVTTFVGGGGHGSQDGVGNDARFYDPSSVAVDRAGNVYVADFFNSTIRKITPQGVVTTFAGKAGEGGSADGQGDQARFTLPSGVATDKAGNVYVADTYNYTIRKITSAGFVTTVAGMAGQGGFVDGIGSGARFSGPMGVAVNSAGEIFVGDTYNNAIRKITPDGAVTTVAGGTYGSADGTGTEAQFAFPQGLALDAAGNIYVADEYNAAIRKITPDAVVTTYVSNLIHPTGVASDPRGVLFVAEYWAYKIDRVSAAGARTQFAGGNFSSEDGFRQKAGFNYPRGVALDRLGNLYVADERNETIRKITPSGAVSTLAGSSNIGSQDAASGSEARFFFPFSAVSDPAGTIYVADTYNHTIRKVTPAGAVTTLAGKPVTPGSSDGQGRHARFNYPTATAVDNAGNVYVADTANCTIRKITPEGSVTTLAGLAGQPGSSDGFGSEARFNFPEGIAVNGAGTVYVADSANETIRQISPAGEVITLAGSVGKSGKRDGTGSEARFNDPNGLSVARRGAIFVADHYNESIRMITPDGTVTTFVGGARNGSNDGTGSDASFRRPRSVVVDATGYLYVTDTENFTLRKVTPDAMTTTLAGVPLSGGWVDGTGSEARFAYLTGVAADANGSVYVVDNNAIRKAVPDARQQDQHVSIK